MSSQLTVPLSSLSADLRQRHAQLRDYFCDKDAQANCIDGQWALALSWSDDPYRYVDPRLDEGLAWWGADVQYQDMAKARKRRGKLLLALNDTWTLQSWSEWLARTPHHEDIVVLHVDDHKDLDAPRFFNRPDGWFDPIGCRPVDLHVPHSVTDAIMSGALGMGSFLTPFLHRHPDTEVRQLCQGPKCTRTIDSQIILESVADTLLDPSALRPAVSLIADDQGTGNGRYRFTHDLDLWLEGLSKTCAPILLHVDMDYFCNRYDGDSDHIDHPGPLNDALPQILSSIDALTKALHRHGLAERLVDIVIAFSPGFFPAEFWAESCDRLLIGLGEQPWGDQ
ncbi:MULTISPECIES: hypothetical protein [Pseudomonas]|uniref:hypothetical protein n=1 Tax=Pseudomonas TaxID=286 RepID=UPI0002F11F66|nr:MULTISPECIES: hypothetical protein [Pseudomonas]